MRILRYLILALALHPGPEAARAEAPQRGHLLIVGGGLRPDNAAVFGRLIDFAGGRDRARFGVLPIASKSQKSAQRFTENLVRHGIAAEQIRVIDLTLENAAWQADSPAVVRQIRDCTGLFFVGGDQQRITRALLRADGGDTLALQAIREVWSSGGVLSGSSAGAAGQSDPTIGVSGLPDDSLDEGMDALDFGLTQRASRRGLLVTSGLGFFRAGLIDQHFSQYRGRLGRLSRATIEQKIRYGFGIDENTALAVTPDGMIEVVGEGSLTLVDADQAKCEDGPLGCRMTGVRVSCLQDGDRFDPTTGTSTVHRGKTPIVEGHELNNGNFLIPDIAGEGAVFDALVAGLADNTSRKQVGVTLRYNQHFGHGYRFTFAKTDRTRSYAGDVNGIFSYAVLGVLLDIEPVVSTLQSPEATLPADLPRDSRRKPLEAIVYRGIMLADDRHNFRPSVPITRAEMANAVAQTIHLEPARRDPPVLSDVSPSAPSADEIARVVAAGFMRVDDRGAFRPEQAITRQEAATILVKVAETYRTEHWSSDPVALTDAAKISPEHLSAVFAALHASFLETEDHQFRPAAALTREQAATAIYKIVGFPW